MKKIINVGVVAHVDAGKSTLVDALLQQSNVFSDHETIVEQVMDSNDLERERGITIYSKNCAIEHEGVKINIVDTPGHADFSSEVERILKTVDTIILLVDSSEGPMPQTRVLLEKSLEIGHRPILFINKIDKKDARSEEVVDMSFDLFAELGASDEQLDFPIVYGVAKEGIATRDLDVESSDLTPLFDLLLEHVPPYLDLKDKPLQFQISSLDYDDYQGRMGMGRILRGTLKKGSQVMQIKRDGTLNPSKVNKLYVYQGLSRVEVSEAYAGDMVIFSGLPSVSIGETITDMNHVKALPPMTIEQPTLTMHFMVNDSPFSGRSGKFLTSRQIRDRLEKELETNVGLRVEPLEAMEGYKVSGRGELHLSILLERMRREGYELSVSKPEVLLKEMNGVIHEPFERVMITLEDPYAGMVITHMNVRRGILQSMTSDAGYTKLEYLVPTRGLIGYRSQFINATHGTGIMEKVFYKYLPYVGAIESDRNGVFISKENGTAMAYSLFNLSERGQMFIEPASEVYEGMIVGLHSRANDLVVNPCKNKKLTNVRSSGTDEALKVISPRKFTLEEALEFIAEDELVEITPDAIRMRKKQLNEKDRKNAQKRMAE
ncbi:MAG: translational GTPase TypA [Candidatus Izemoplasmataceae bacterium]